MPSHGRVVAGILALPCVAGLTLTGASSDPEQMALLQRDLQTRLRYALSSVAGTHSAAATSPSWALEQEVDSGLAAPKVNSERVLQAFLELFGNYTGMEEPRFAETDMIHAQDREFLVSAFKDVAKAEGLSAEHVRWGETRFLRLALAELPRQLKKFPGKRARLPAMRTKFAQRLQMVFLQAIHENQKEALKERTAFETVIAAEEAAHKRARGTRNSMDTKAEETRLALQVQQRREGAAALGNEHAGVIGQKIKAADELAGVSVRNAFTVTTGACFVDSHGCVHSPNYPGNYSNRESCIIAVDTSIAGPIRVVHFDTERGYDALVVNNIRHSGNDGPWHVVPVQDMTWFSDYAGTATGFTLCPTAKGSELEHKPNPRDMFILTDGMCTVDDNGCLLSPYFPQSYPYSDSCIVDVLPDNALPLTVYNFSTEDDFDILSINGEAFSGHLGPQGVVPQGQITWSSDENFANAGWQLCPTQPEDPTVQVKAANKNNTFFTIRSGNCTTDVNGCLMSPNYPHFPYMNEDTCVINVNRETTGPLDVVHFDTETAYDVLIVNGMRFSGSHGPQDILPFEDIVWNADYSGTRAGFKICARAKSDSERVEEPLNPRSVFSVTKGRCHVDHNGCATSPNYPQPYDNNSACTISVAENNTYRIRVEDFLVESHIDTVVINGKNFSGIYGPEGVIPTGDIQWYADSDTEKMGWKLCISSQSTSEELSDSGTIGRRTSALLYAAVLAIPTLFSFLRGA